MDKFNLKKQGITEKLAVHVLSHGIKEASLRKLAAAVNLRDRMLLHYFTDKKELITSILFVLLEQLEQILQTLSCEQMPYKMLILHLSKAIDDERIRPYLNIALQLTIKNEQKEEYYADIATEIYEKFFLWISSMLKVEREEQRAEFASLTYVIIEGIVLLDAVNSKETIKNAIKCIEYL